jgi:hypothetical protein
MSSTHRPVAISHATAAEIELYVIDALGAAGRRRFERHVAACHLCAGQLAAEAAAEVVLVALWPRVSRPLAAVVPLRPLPQVAMKPPPSGAVWQRARAPGRGSAGGLAAAVVAVLLMGWWSEGGRASSGPRSSPTAPLAACVATGSAGRARALQDRLSCIDETPPAPAALASWGVCAPAVPPFGTARCPGGSSITPFVQ